MRQNLEMNVTADRQRYADPASADVAADAG
jgi:hypothetical protein